MLRESERRIDKAQRTGDKAKQLAAQAAHGAAMMKLSTAEAAAMTQRISASYASHARDVVDATAARQQRRRDLKVGPHLQTLAMRITAA
jgi:hypothetical protein